MIDSCPIRYSNCWEDAEVILSAMKVREGRRYFSVASAGDNVLSILSRGPQLVVAVDTSCSEIACLELRKVAFACLPYPDVKRFLGIEDCANRVTIYNRLRSTLPEEARNFWDKRKPLIDQGIIHAGRVEHYFNWFRKYALPVILTRNQTNALLSHRIKDERRRHYDRQFNSWRWRVFLKILFNRLVLSRFDLGRNQRMYNAVTVDISQRVRERIEYGLTSQSSDNNPYLEYIILGNFKRSLPHYLQPENFEKIRRNLERLVIIKGDICDVLRQNRKIRFDGFNLSDVFEYMSDGKYLQSLYEVISQSRKGSRLVYWNNLIHRSIPRSLQNRLMPLDHCAQDFFTRNRAFFYDSLVVAEAQC